MPKSKDRAANRFAAHAFFQMVLLASLSLAAAQPIPGFKDINWDIVLFLTPIGIVKNLIAESSVMRSFYLDLSRGQGDLGQAQAIAVAVIILLMVINFILLLQSLRLAPSREKSRDEGHPR